MHGAVESAALVLAERWRVRCKLTRQHDRRRCSLSGSTAVQMPTGGTLKIKVEIENREVDIENRGCENPTAVQMPTGCTLKIKRWKLKKVDIENRG